MYHVSYDIGTYIAPGYYPYIFIRILLSLINFHFYISDTEHFLSSNTSKFWKYTRNLEQNFLIPSSVHLIDEVSISL